MRWTLVLLCLPLLFVVATPGWSQPTDWGVSASSATANCPSFCTSFSFGVFGGGLNESDASSTVANVQGTGDSRATLDVTSGISVPVLRAAGSSVESSLGSGFGDAFAVEGYSYDGAEPSSFTIDVSLTGVVVDSTPVDLDTSIDARVVVFQEAPFSFTSDYGTLVFEFGAVPIDETQLRLTGSSTSASSSLTFTVNPGESFYVWATLGADAERDLSSADALSTLTMVFQDSTGLTAASVPEPGAMPMLCAGVLLLASRRGPLRSKRRSSPRHEARELATNHFVKNGSVGLTARARP
ncbi:MAG: hypothetical protein IPK00_05800 [Deltaproteobacteria bacterium]|nr:hypothetical protein [Deltaproteobacteria bacterium]